jgi:hypothetical protein
MDAYVDAALAYLQATPVAAAAIGLVLLYLLIRKTKVFLFLLVLAVVLGTVLFMIAEIAGTGGAAKREMINQSATQDVK